MKADNLKNNERIVITHGEACFIPVETTPRGKHMSTKRYIAAHSETGHHHVLESQTEFEVYEGKMRYVVIKDLAKLWHQKTQDIHETRILTPGVYKITEKTEYNPFTKITQRVFD